VYATVNWRRNVRFRTLIRGNNDCVGPRKVSSSDSSPSSSPLLRWVWWRKGSGTKSESGPVEVGGGGTKAWSVAAPLSPVPPSDRLPEERG
jgi:hypothetical protein